MGDVAEVTTDPKTEMDQFYESQPAETPAEETTAPAAETPAAQDAKPENGPTPTTPDFWSEKVEDDDLPPSLKGLTRKEYFERTKDIAAKAHQAGYQKNEAEAKLRVAEATLAAYQRQMGQQPQQPREPFTIEQFAQAPAQYIEQVARNVADEVRKNEVAPLSDNLLRMQGDMAREKARSALGIDPDVWNSITPALAAHMAANNYDPRDDQAWLHSATMYKQQAARFFPQPVKTEAPPNPAGQAKPAATTPTQRKVATTGNKHVDSALKEQLETWNKLPGVKKMTIEDFADMIQAEQTFGGWR